MISYNPSPLQAWEDDLFLNADIRVWIKRDDQIHPLAGGNKVRKLKGQLTDAALAGKEGVLTFGGVVSNHLVATAVLCQQAGIPMRAILRGDPVRNFTTDILQKNQVRMEFLSRSTFDEAMAREEPAWLTIPLGGSHKGALIGVGEIVDEVDRALPDGPFTYCVPMGTGGTAAGLAHRLTDRDTLLIYPAIKGPDLPGEWAQVVKRLEVVPRAGIEIVEGAARGGFARKDADLWQQLVSLSSRMGVWWDPVYNGKMVLQFLGQIRTGFFPSGSRIILVHTGGLPGLLGYQQRFGFSRMPHVPDVSP